MSGGGIPFPHGAAAALPAASGPRPPREPGAALCVSIERRAQRRAPPWITAAGSSAGATAELCGT